MNIHGLSDGELAGQRMMVGFDGVEFNSDLKFLIKELKVGGIIIFARNIVAPAQVAGLCYSVQNYAKECGLPPLFIAIDQEGGQVARLREPFTQFPKGSPAMRNTHDAKRFAEITAGELKSIGVNMNMAPVMDVQPEGFAGIMAKRVFSGGPEFVAQMGMALISGLQDNGIMAVAKHFPGIGRTTLDSHLELPVLETDYNELIQTDFVPFEASIGCGVAGMMLSHIQYNSIDPNWPASLSVKIVKILLREKMGFRGVVMTDDLDMKAINVDIKTSVQRIMEAHVDIALICHKGPDIETAHQEFVSQIEASPMKKEQCLDSVERIMGLKDQYLV